MIQSRNFLDAVKKNLVKMREEGGGCNIFHGCPKFHIINLARWPTFNQVRTDIRPLCI